MYYQKAHLVFICEKIKFVQRSSITSNLKQKMTTHLQTPRLILRQWNDSDTAPFIQMCADEDVMRYFPAPLTSKQSLQFIEKVTRQINQYGWGLWAVELKQTKEFIGFIGLQPQPELFEFSPCIEIGWRLAKILASRLCD